MLEIKEISIENLSKNILVTYFDPILKGHSRRGFNPLIGKDWMELESDPELVLYKNIAWNGLSRPEIEEIIIVDEHE